MDAFIKRAKSEQDGTAKAVFLTENLGQHGHGFFGSILLVACDQDDMPGVCGRVRGRELKAISGGQERDRKQGKEGEQDQSEDGG